MKIRRAAAAVLLGGLAACGSSDTKPKPANVHSLGMDQHPPRSVQLEIQRDMYDSLPYCLSQGHAVSGWAEKMSDGSLQIYTRCEGSPPESGT